MNGSTTCRIDNARPSRLLKAQGKIKTITFQDSEESDELTKLVEEKNKKPKRGKTFRQGFIEEMKWMAEHDDWKDATPRHFIELGAELHKRVYGVETEEPKQASARGLAASVNSLMKQLGTSELLNFIYWAWQREQGREKYRRERNQDGGRLTLAFLFQSANIRTDYRIHCARVRHQPKR